MNALLLHSQLQLQLPLHLYLPLHLLKKAQSLWCKTDSAILHGNPIWPRTNRSGLDNCLLTDYGHGWKPIEVGGSPWFQKDSRGVPS